MREGPVTTESVQIIAPPAICKEDSCVFYKIYFPSGTVALGGKIPRGQTTAKILWKDLIKKDHFDPNDRGFWPIQMEIHWLDKDGKDHASWAEGEIRLRILKANYTPLYTSADDSNFVWNWTQDGHIFKMTTGARGYVGKN